MNICKCCLNCKFSEVVFEDETDLFEIGKLICLKTKEEVEDEDVCNFFKVNKQRAKDIRLGL